MKLKEHQKWGKTRLLGKTKFIVQYGVLRWGLLTAVLWSVIMQFLQPTGQWYLRTVIALILFPLGGIFFGIFLWNMNEKKYKSFEE